MVASLLDREIYSYSDVDRLVELPSGTAKRWLNGYVRSRRFYSPLLRPEPRDDDIVTWGEMVEARLVAGFRAKSVPVQHLRPAIVRLRAEFGLYPLAHAKPFLDVHGRELVMKIQDETSLARPLQIVVVRNDQLELSGVADEFRASVQFRDGSAASIVPEPRTPDILLDPARGFGQPVIRQRSVMTATLAEDYRAGASPLELTELYELSVGEVEQALRFELIVNRVHAA